MVLPASFLPRIITDYTPGFKKEICYLNPQPIKVVFYMTNEILYNLTQDNEGIYSYPFQKKGQESEIRLRTEVAKEKKDHLDEICKHHSIEVMNREVKLFLRKMPKNATEFMKNGHCRLRSSWQCLLEHLVRF